MRACVCPCPHTNPSGLKVGRDFHRVLVAFTLYTRVGHTKASDAERRASWPTQSERGKTLWAGCHRGVYPIALQGVSWSSGEHNGKQLSELSEHIRKNKGVDAQVSLRDQLKVYAGKQRAQLQL